MIQYKRKMYGDTLYNTWWLFGLILVLWWPVDEAEYDGDAHDGNS